MNNATPNNASQESSKMCLFEPRVFSDTQDIADEQKPPCDTCQFTTY